MQQKNIKLVQEFEQLIQLIQNPKIFLNNYFSYIRNEVDLAYFERKSNLNNEQSSIKMKEQWNDLISKINSFEFECCLNSTPFNDTILREKNEKIQFIESKLNILMQHEDDYDEYLEDSDQLLQQEINDLINDEAIKLENILFLNKTIIFLNKFKYQSNPMNKIGEEEKCLFDKMDNETIGRLLIISNQYLGQQAIDFLKEYFSI